MSVISEPAPTKAKSKKKGLSIPLIIGTAICEPDLIVIVVVLVAAAIVVALLLVGVLVIWRGMKEEGTAQKDEGRHYSLQEVVVSLVTVD